MSKKSKAYKAAAELVDKGRLYAPIDATTLVKARPEHFAMFEPAQFGEPTYFAWVLRPGDDSASLAEAINEALLKMTDDGRVKEIQEKWLGAYTELPREVPAN